MQIEEKKYPVTYCIHIPQTKGLECCISMCKDRSDVSIHFYMKGSEASFWICLDHLVQVQDLMSEALYKLGKAENVKIMRKLQGRE